MKETKQNLLANSLIVLAILSRLIPHPANFTSIGATALVCGAKLNRTWRWAVPFITLILSDMLLNLFFGKTAFSAITPFIYGSFTINILLGGWVHGKHRYLKLGAFGTLASFQFFILTNLGVWLSTEMYTKNIAGLVQCYFMALPFWYNSLIGDILWSLALYTVIDRSQSWISRKEATAQV